MSIFDKAKSHFRANVKARRTANTNMPNTHRGGGPTIQHGKMTISSALLFPTTQGTIKSK